MKTKPSNIHIKTENVTAVELYSAGHSILEIAQLQNRETGAIASAIHRQRKRTPEAKQLQKHYSFMSDKTKLDVKAGALIPTITQDLCPKIQKWILRKTSEENYDSIASFFTDLAAEAYFADQ
jgi:hypothetical protein